MKYADGTTVKIGERMWYVPHFKKEPELRSQVYKGKHIPRLVGRIGKDKEQAIQIAVAALKKRIAKLTLLEHPGSQNNYVRTCLRCGGSRAGVYHMDDITCTCGKE